MMKYLHYKIWSLVSQRGLRLARGCLFIAAPFSDNFVSVYSASPTFLRRAQTNHLPATQIIFKSIFFRKPPLPPVNCYMEPAMEKKCPNTAPRGLEWVVSGFLLTKKPSRKGLMVKNKFLRTSFWGGKMENGIISLTKTEFGGLPGHRMGRMMSASWQTKAKNTRFLSAFLMWNPNRAHDGWWESEQQFRCKSDWGWGPDSPKAM